MYKRFKTWLMLKLAIWKLNSIQRSLKRYGWVKYEKNLSAMTKDFEGMLWGNVPLDAFRPKEEVVELSNLHGEYTGEVTGSEEEVVRLIAFAEAKNAARATKS
jgi:hypothetical protein